MYLDTISQYLPDAEKFWSKETPLRKKIIRCSDVAYDWHWCNLHATPRPKSMRQAACYKCYLLVPVSHMKKASLVALRVWSSRAGVHAVAAAVEQT